MNRLFVDTWGWLTLRDKRESQHEAVAGYVAQLRQSGVVLYTTDFVLDETFTLLFKRLPFQTAQASMHLLDEAVAAGALQLVRISPDRFTQTKQLRLKLQDKPNISFTDLSSMVVMAELGIDVVLTGDAHFAHVGMGFQLVP